jgi:hypothetical protein
MATSVSGLAAAIRGATGESSYAIALIFVDLIRFF